MLNFFSFCYGKIGKLFMILVILVIAMLQRGMMKREASEI